eukprot:scaffold98419_cov64-Phaeocystis_antarctica.AAC.2
MRAAVRAAVLVDEASARVLLLSHRAPLGPTAPGPLLRCRGRRGHGNKRCLRRVLAVAAVVLVSSSRLGSGKGALRHRAKAYRAKPWQDPLRRTVVGGWGHSPAASCCYRPCVCAAERAWLPSTPVEVVVLAGVCVQESVRGAAYFTSARAASAPHAQVGPLPKLAHFSHPSEELAPPAPPPRRSPPRRSPPPAPRPPRRRPPPRQQVPQAASWRLPAGRAPQPQAGHRLPRSTRWQWQRCWWACDAGVVG